MATKEEPKKRVGKFLGKGVPRASEKARVKLTPQAAREAREAGFLAPKRGIIPAVKEEVVDPVVAGAKEAGATGREAFLGTDVSGAVAPTTTALDPAAEAEITPRVQPSGPSVLGGQYGRFLATAGDRQFAGNLNTNTAAFSADAGETGQRGSFLGLSDTEELPSASRIPESRRFNPITRQYESGVDPSRGTIQASPQAIERVAAAKARQGKTKEAIQRDQDAATAREQQFKSAQLSADTQITTEIVKAAGGDRVAQQNIQAQIQIAREKGDRAMLEGIYSSVIDAVAKGVIGPDGKFLSAEEKLASFKPLIDQITANTQQPTDTAGAPGRTDTNANNIPDEEEERFSSALAAIQEYDALPENDPRRQSSASVYEKAKVAKATYLTKYKQQLG